MNSSSALSTRSELRQSYWAVALIMGLMGAFFWAIRGTGGFGGSSGGLFAGVGWGILWFRFSSLAGYRGRLSSPWMIVAITLGIAYGGMTGYGVYIGWLRGQFYLDYPQGAREIDAWTGYAMLFVCGLHWGGVTGAFMAWCRPSASLQWWHWLLRLMAGALGAGLALWLVRSFPQYVLPFYSEGLYSLAENSTCLRAERTIREIAPHVGLFLGFFAFELVRRDWKAVGLMLVMSLGFAVPFCVGGYWQTFNGSTIKLDWWKYWEMSIGLGGGLAFGLAYYLFNSPEEDNEQRPSKRHSNRAYILGAGFPIWLAIVRSAVNAFDGTTKLHGYEEFANSNRWWVLLSVLVPATILLVGWIDKVQWPRDNSNHPSSRRARITSIIVWSTVLALTAMLLHRVAIPFIPDVVFGYCLLVLPPVFLVIGYWLFWPVLDLECSPIPRAFLDSMLLLMVCMGLIASLHWPMQLNNYVLVGSYLVCIFASWILQKYKLHEFAQRD